MVVIECELDTVKKATGLPKDKIIDGLSNLGAPCEEEDGKLIVELTPNRPDWFSQEGLIRALNAFYNGKITNYEKVKKSGYRLIVGDVPFRPYAAWALVRKLRLDDQKIREIIRLQEKLDATIGRKVKKLGIGFYPLKGVAFPIRYELWDPKKIVYQPLNYAKEADAKEILQAHPKGKEYGYLLEDKEKYPVYVDNNNNIMCLIPIVNSAQMGKIDGTTHEILVEVTGTNMDAVKGTLNIICCSLIDMGGSVESIEMRYGDKKFDSPDLGSRKIRLDIVAINRVLGLTLKKDEVVPLLKKMGFGVRGNTVHIPPYRNDIIDFVDVVEDVAIAYGYNNFEPRLPNFFSAGKILAKYDRISDILYGMGFIETKNSILTSKSKVVGTQRCMEIKNPASVECEVLRPNIVGSMLEIFTINSMKGVPQKIYEIGNVYGGALETRVGIAVMDKRLDFSEFRSYLQTFFFEIGKSFELRKKDIEFFDKEISAEICVDGKPIGIVGRVKKEHVEKIGFDVFIAELVL